MQTDEEGFFISPQAVKVALERLAARKIHPQFAGYLAAVEQSVMANKQTGLKVGFKAFFDRYLQVGGAPVDRPYLTPFGSTLQLFNSNVAGSYAPSSLRGVAPIKGVMMFRGAGQNVTHALRPNHEQRARAHLASEAVPALSLATFLFRDHFFEGGVADPKVTVMGKFESTFGYNLFDRAKRSRFDALYVVDSETFDGVVYAEFHRGVRVANG